jgi:site-specific DNA-cytosine methylase
MGYDRHGCVAALKRAGICESTRNAWLAESVPSLMAESCASLALAHVATDQQPSVWRVGSLFSGARDALSAGFTDAGCAVESTFAAESDPDRLRVLRMHRAPRNEYASAEEASVCCPCVDALVASPPCDRVSRARDNSDDPTGPARRTASDFKAIVTTVRRSQPLVVVVEQSDGLASHQPAAYAAADQALRELPYAWSHTCSDAHSDCGSSHVRARLLWVGVRVDVFVP